jgi:hypothetical protein
VGRGHLGGLHLNRGLLPDVLYEKIRLGQLLKGVPVRSLKLKVSLLAAALAMSAPAFAVDTDLGILSRPLDSKVVRGFDSGYVGGFTDYYTFTVDHSAAIVDGEVAGIFWGVIRWGFDVDSFSYSISEWNGENFVTIPSGRGGVVSPLLIGEYRLTVQGNVLPSDGTPPGLGSKPGYWIETQNVHVALPAPEPADLALTALGLAGVGFWARRRPA